MSRLFAILAAALLLLAGVSARADPRGPIYHQAPAMDRTVRERISPQVERLLDRLASEKRRFRLDGVEVFAAQDRFLPGKIAIAMADLIVATPKHDPRLGRRLEDFRRLARLTLDDPNDSWGVYYYLSALYELRQAGLLERASDPATLSRLRAQLDWRRFVRPDDLTLIDLPNNYYGVAFSIARLRTLLGWEDRGPGEALLTRTLQHFRDYSGAYGFADETNGEGRFDRYSVLLVGEIAQRFIEIGEAPPPEVRAWLRKSVDLVLPRLNLRGEGFEYGRSIGAYGETALVEVLSAAAALDVLSEREKAMAYAFSCRVAARYADVWLDPATGSVNLWDKGRKTDAYRGKNRILGENLSLAHQFAYTNALWSRLGFAGRAPDPGFEAWLATLPRATVTWFSRGESDRLLFTWRDGARVVGLPLINGGPGQHMNNPYFPAPFSPGVLAGAADETFPQLVPRLTLDDGSVLAPLAWFRDVKVSAEGDHAAVAWRQDRTDRLGEASPRPDSRIAVETRYDFEPGTIRRSDRFQLAPGVDAAEVSLEFATFSGGVHGSATEIVFDRGEVSGFAVEGLTCRAAPATSAAYRSPVGAFVTVVRCRGRLDRASGRVSWRLSFRAPAP